MLVRKKGKRKEKKKRGRKMAAPSPKPRWQLVLCNLEALQCAVCCARGEVVTCTDVSVLWYEVRAKKMLADESTSVSSAFAFCILHSALCVLQESKGTT